MGNSVLRMGNAAVLPAKRPASTALEQYALLEERVE